ncbi:MAG: DUF4386 domain-containing protein [Acidobacteria bacterium]|nr:DUF4386 domain-containing protein [Acidobacteriota bacterium]
MNPLATPARSSDLSPNTKARLAGVLLLITMAGGAFAQGIIASRLIVGGDAAATAGNITTHEALYRLAFAVYLMEMACQIAATVLFYDLLKPVSKPGASLMAAFGLAGCTIKTLGRVFFFAPLLVLGGGGYLRAFNVGQLQAASLLALRLNYTAETIAMVFFGLGSLLKGYLVFRSTFLPQALGVLSSAGGLGWMFYLYEPLAFRLQSYIVGAGFVGALATVLWLLVKGIDDQRWKERADAAAASDWR